MLNQALQARQVLVLIFEHFCLSLVFHMISWFMLMKIYNFSRQPVYIQSAVAIYTLNALIKASVKDDRNLNSFILI